VKSKLTVLRFRQSEREAKKVFRVKRRTKNPIKTPTTFFVTVDGL
jgi:hypothetical protein